MLSRRHLIGIAGVALAADPVRALSQIANSKPIAARDGWQHSLSRFHDVRYPAGFDYFDYVNSSAPKGGTVRQIVPGTFDNFNPVVAGIKGKLASGIDLLFDSLMTPSLDEVSTVYCRIASGVRGPADSSSVSYLLHPDAKWHDGVPISPEDVLFTFDAFRANNPVVADYLRGLLKVEKTGDREVRFTFAMPASPEFAGVVGQVQIVSKHWWEGTAENGRPRDVAQTTLEPPLGSGPYRIKDFAVGTSIVFERVADYWARDLNVAVGHNNFDELHFSYLRDFDVALEAFKADLADWRIEESAKNWATAYDIAAVREGRILLEEFPETDQGIMQAFIFNVRLDKYSDPMVRRAFNLAFDFDEIRHLFFGSFIRISSYFEGSELAARDLPQGRELEILNTVRDQVPPEVFTAPYANPAGGTPEAVRANIREAMGLLKSAGYDVKDGKLVSATDGRPLTSELLIAANAGMERAVSFFKPSLERLGVTVSVRSVDAVQYTNRLRHRDFDMTVASWSETLSPGNEQRDQWGSRAADIPGSRNYIGIKNPAVDALIESIVAAADRDELMAATKALDRVLLWNYYVIPQWTYPNVRTARWDRFGRPARLPKHGGLGFPELWWWDTERAARTGSRG